MALATQCPHCQTTFRVAHDQLKLRAGLVRCGACKEIFNGVEHLLRPDQLPQPFAVPNAIVAPPSPASDPTDAATEDTTHTQPVIEPAAVALQTPDPDKQDISSTETGQMGEPATGSVSLPASDPSTILPQWPVAADSSSNDDPLQRMTLMDITGYDESENGDSTGPDTTGAEQSKTGDSATQSLAEENTDAPDELSQAIEELQRKPWRGTKKNADAKEPDDAYDAEFTEPAFVKRARQQQRIGRSLRILMRAVSFILLVALFAQGAYTFRNQLAASFPQTAPALAKACTIIGCKIERPSQIDAVSLESSELQALPSVQNIFVLTSLLRNRSSTAQEWPNIELTLNDANEKPIARRVFTPREYLLSTQELTKGFAANSEQPIKLFFELSQLKASGYRVYLFYP